jgi:hypothetical protein
MRVLAFISSGIVLFLMILGGAWWWYTTRDARARDNADAFVTMFHDDGRCKVRRHLESADVTMPCGEVGHYLRGTLRLNAGATVSIAVSTNASKSSIDGLTMPISHEGYTTVGILRIGFLTEPNGPR